MRAKITLNPSFCLEITRICTIFANKLCQPLLCSILSQMEETNVKYLFRCATPVDSDACWQIIKEAKTFFASLGRAQWNEHYPSMSIIEADIAHGNAYVIEENGQIVAYGAIIFSGEEAYNSINGEWLSIQPYVVVHRLCVADEARGKGYAQKYLQEVEKIAIANNIHSFKVDTNHDNAEMLHIFHKCSFAYCGEIAYPHGTRLAFEKLI